MTCCPSDYAIFDEGVCSIDPATNRWRGPDNAPAIQAAIDEAWRTGDTVEFDQLMLSGPLNLTKRLGGVRIVGNGHRLVPSVACHQLPLLDCTGSDNIRLEDLGIGDIANPSHAACAVLLADAAGAPAVSNVHHLSGVTIDGPWSRAALYVCGGSSSQIDDSEISNSMRSTGLPAAWFTTTNGGGLSSIFTNVAPSGGVSEWTIQGTEFHQTGCTTEPSSDPVLILDGVDMWTMVGGNIGGNGPELVACRGAVSNLNLQFVQCYAQDPGGVTPRSTFSIQNNVTGMVLEGCRLDASSETFRLRPGASLSFPFVAACRAYGGAGHLLRAEQYGFLNNPQILSGMGLRIDVGGGAVNKGIVIDAFIDGQSTALHHA